MCIHVYIYNGLLLLLYIYYYMYIYIYICIYIYINKGSENNEQNDMIPSFRLLFILDTFLHDGPDMKRSISTEVLQSLLQIKQWPIPSRKTPTSRHRCCTPSPEELLVWALMMKFCFLGWHSTEKTCSISMLTSHKQIESIYINTYIYIYICFIYPTHFWRWRIVCYTSKYEYIYIYIYIYKI